MAEEKRKKGRGSVWAGVISALDPIIRRTAQKLAAKVPEDSPLRSGTVEMAIGVVKGFSEAMADSLPTPLKLAVEKITDFGDFFSGALGSAPTTGPAVDDWMKKFFTESGQRLRKTRNVQAEFDKIKLEFELRQQLLELIKQSQPKPEAKPEPEPVSWQEELEKLKQSFVAKKGAEAIGNITDHVNKFNVGLENWHNRVTAWSERR